MCIKIAESVRVGLEVKLPVHSPTRIMRSLGTTKEATQKMHSHYYVFKVAYKCALSV